MSTRRSNEEILKIYQVALEMADRHSARRIGSNSFFLTLQGVLIAALGLFIKSEDNFTNTTYTSMIVLSALGVLLGTTWILTIKSYGDLSTAKWGVILEIEKSLPIKPFTDEWRLVETEDYLNWKKELSGYKRPRKLFKWLRERHKYYTPQSSIERYIPIVLIFSYLLVTLISLIGVVTD